MFEISRTIRDYKQENWSMLYFLLICRPLIIILKSHQCKFKPYRNVITSIRSNSMEFTWLYRIEISGIIRDHVSMASLWSKSMDKRGLLKQLFTEESISQFVQGSLIQGWHNKRKKES